MDDADTINNPSPQTLLAIRKMIAGYRDDLHVAKERLKVLEATIAKYQQHLLLLGAEECKDGTIRLDTKKYHTAFRCELHRQGPWYELDVEHSCLVCLTAEIHELKRGRV